MSGAEPQMSIVVVSWNTRDLLVRCLESVVAHGVSGMEVIVVDNDSADGSAEAARAIPGTRVIETGANLGFARGANVGAAAARGRFVVFLNPDAALRPGALQPLVAHAEANPRDAFVGGACVTSSGAVDPSTARRLPSLWGQVCYGLGLNTVAKDVPVLNPEMMPDWDRRSARTVEMLSGAFLLVRRDVFQSLGGFDPTYFMYAEDADLCDRARAAGWRCAFIPHAVAEHDSGQATTGTAKMVLLLTGKATYLRRRWRGPRRALGLWLQGMGVALRRVLHRGSRRGVDWPEVWRQRRVWFPGYPTQPREESVRGPCPNPS